MKITLYTITDCQFSKQEKEYLASHGLQFEEKNLETNREFLTEMLAVGGNFAGTPVTKIEKDDGQIVVLKGFTAAEFDKTLALAPTVAKPVEAAPQSTQPLVQAPVTTPTPVQQPMTPPEPVVPIVATTTDPAMASVLNTLEQQAQVAPPVQTQIPPVAAPVAPSAPVIPDPQF